MSPTFLFEKNITWGLLRDSFDTCARLASFRPFR